MEAQGTWQFISITGSLDPWSWPHRVSDDLESFFWVLLYQVCRYRSRWTDALKGVVRTVFDSHVTDSSNGVTTGGLWKLSCVNDISTVLLALYNHVAAGVTK
jgi:hypothetical protein